MLCKTISNEPTKNKAERFYASTRAFMVVIITCILILSLAFVFSTETEAATANEQLDYTDTYFYDRINERQQQCYNWLKEHYDSYTGERGSFKLDLSHLLPEGSTEEDYNQLGMDFIIGQLALYADNPLYETKGEFNGFGSYVENGKRIFLVDFTYSYIYTDDAKDQMETQIDQIVRTIGDGDRYTKLYKLTHYLITNTFYDPYVDIFNGITRKDNIYSLIGFIDKFHSRATEYVGSACGSLLKNIAVCQGYTEVVKLLCNELDIPCIVMGNHKHAWNLVQMENGEWYRLDITDACSLGWDGSNNIDAYFKDEFLNNNTFRAAISDDYKDPYMIALNNVAYVKDFPKEAKDRYEYKGTNTDFSYTVAPSTYTPCFPTFSYSVHVGGKTCTIDNFEGEVNGDLVIPETIDGYTVTEIGPYAFYYCTDITGKLVIPNTVENIEFGAFAGCYNITSVQFPKELRTIGTGAFAGCKSLTEIVLPDYLEEVSKYAFYDCDKLSTVSIGTHVQLVDEEAFGNIDSTMLIKAPSNSPAHEYATNNNLSFKAFGTQCPLIDTDGEWEFDNIHHFHTCEHGGRFDRQVHVKNNESIFSCGHKCDVCDAQRCYKFGFMESTEVIVNAHPANCIVAEFTGDIVCICGDFYLGYGKYIGEPTGIHIPLPNSLKYTEWLHYETCKDCGTMCNIENHYGGTATETKKAVCKACNSEYGEFLHVHNLKWFSAGDTHYQFCLDCYVSLENFESHRGGNATEDYPAKCDTCGEYYGDVLPHTKHVSTHWIYASVEFHYQICDKCGEEFNKGSHSGGVATPTELAVCTLCNGAYGELATHTHSLSDWINDESFHYKMCQICGEQFEIEEHRGGYVPNSEVGTCDVCGCEYKTSHLHVMDNWVSIDDKTHHQICEECGTVFSEGPHSGGANDGRCDICGAEYEEIAHTHTASHWQCDTYRHSQVCTVCGIQFNDGSHKGGIATETQRAECEVCGAEYGSYEKHKHSLSEWKYDKNTHWKICEGCEKVFEHEVHFGSDVTKDGNTVCEKCGTEFGKNNMDVSDIILIASISAACAGAAIITVFVIIRKKRRNNKTA